MYVPISVSFSSPSLSHLSNTCSHLSSSLLQILHNLSSFLSQYFPFFISFPILNLAILFHFSSFFPSLTSQHLIFCHYFVPSVIFGFPYLFSSLPFAFFPPTLSFPRFDHFPFPLNLSLPDPFFLYICSPLSFISTFPLLSHFSSLSSLAPSRPFAPFSFS